MSFQKIDLNNDGIVTHEEAKKSEGGLLTDIIEGVFQVADKNRDGQITLAEFSSVVDQDRPLTQVSLVFSLFFTPRKSSQNKKERRVRR